MGRKLSAPVRSLPADGRDRHAHQVRRGHASATICKRRPASVVLFAGYASAKEYQQARGHVYAIEDVTKTKRVNDKTPATCWTCKSPDVPRLMATIGPGKFYAASFDDLKKEITHPIGCLDCHEPNTMKLRITRPALREAFTRQGKDVDRASHQEMRTLVCAQCHVEYYFQKKGNYLTFPWDKGTTPEQMEQYFDEAQFADWTHAISKARMIKIRHPDYEVYRTGVHAYRDVACADCHMPYRTEGGVKFTDHHIQSPLANVANSCAVCHRWGEDELRSRVEGIQDKVHQARGWAETALAQAHFDIAAAEQAAPTTASWPACASWSAAPSCVGITWRPTTAWASTRRRSASALWRRPSTCPSAGSSAPAFWPNTALPSRWPIRISAPRKRPSRRSSRLSTAGRRSCSADEAFYSVGAGSRHPN